VRRPLGRIVLAIVFALFAATGWYQVFVNLLHHSDPPPLTAFHLLIAASATATAIGSWSMARWAPIGALLYGILTAGLLLALTPLLHLDPDSAGGLRTGALVVMIFGALTAWYLRRSSRPRQSAEHGAG